MYTYQVIGVHFFPFCEKHVLGITNVNDLNESHSKQGNWVGIIDNLSKKCIMLIK